MADGALETLVKQLNDRTVVLTNALSAGACADFAEYKYVAGQVRGLAVAHTLVTDLLRNLKENDDD